MFHIPSNFSLKEFALLPNYRHQTTYQITYALKKKYCNKEIIHLPNESFYFGYWEKISEVSEIDPEEHSCEVLMEPPQFELFWGLFTSWWKIKYKNEEFEIVRICLGSDREHVDTWIIVEHPETFQNFFKELHELRSNQPIADICVYTSQGMKEDVQLVRDIQESNFEDLCLESDFLKRLQNELSHFVAAQSIYKKYKLPWKRGIILVGPPGNGKTHFIKTLIHHSLLKCVYIKDWDEVGKMFTEIRKMSPCIIVLEDIDSLVRGYELSSFLNEMDGFANNDGLFFIATTNYPQKIDPALLNRPSRFDKIYEFACPTFDLREQYFKKWNQQVEREMRISEKELKEIATLTKEFSFASLKEVWLGAMLEFVHHSMGENMFVCLKNNIKNIKNQFKALPLHHEKRSEDE